jgi:hypothetical protein
MAPANALGPFLYELLLSLMGRCLIADLKGPAQQRDFL